MSSYEVAVWIRKILLTKSAEVIQYASWSADFGRKELLDTVEKIKKDGSFEWVNPYDLNKEQLDDLGFGLWSEDNPIRLIPLWLFPFIVDGVDYHCISGKIVSEKANMDNDHRFGCLAYGIK